MDLVKDLRDSVIQRCWLLRCVGRLICCLSTIHLSLANTGLIIDYLFGGALGLVCFDNGLASFILLRSLVCNVLDIYLLRYSFIGCAGVINFAL